MYIYQYFRGNKYAYITNNPGADSTLTLRQTIIMQTYYYRFNQRTHTTLIRLRWDPAGIIQRNF